jgi:NADPH-dependent curcumin reductase CurA
MHRLANTASHLNSHLLVNNVTATATTGVTSTTAPPRQFVIKEVPRGALEAGRHFALQEQPPTAARAPLRAGRVRVRVRALTIGAGQRAGLQGSAGYKGASKAESNAVMDGTGWGVVEESADESFVVGDRVMGSTGWRQLATVSASRLTKVRPDVSAAMALGALGTNGLTAYFGLLEIGQPQSGETVVVSAAAGSVGHIVGQIAKIKGCRVVGIAGSDEKCRRLVEELGFDMALNRHDADFREKLKKATPNRISIYFDNTGGPVLQSCLYRMAQFGRICCCGNVSGYDTAKPGGGPRGIPGLLPA